MPEPKIVTGSILTQDYVERELEHQPETEETNIIALSAPEPGTIRKRNRTFRSLLPSLRISVDETHDRVALDGTVIPGDHHVIKFRDGAYRTKVKKEVDAIENSSEWGVTVYDADIWLEKTKDAQAQAIAKQMSDNPELMSQVMSALKVKEGAEDFETPAGEETGEAEKETEEAKEETEEAKEE